MANFEDLEFDDLDFDDYEVNVSVPEDKTTVTNNKVKAENKLTSFCKAVFIFALWFIGLIIISPILNWIIRFVIGLFNGGNIIAIIIAAIILSGLLFWIYLFYSALFHVFLKTKFQTKVMLLFTGLYFVASLVLSFIGLEDTVARIFSVVSVFATALGTEIGFLMMMNK